MPMPMNLAERLAELKAITDDLDELRPRATATGAEMLAFLIAAARDEAQWRIDAIEEGRET